MNPEDYELFEDESGKWPYPVWFVEKVGGMVAVGENPVAGPFDSEEAAADWMADELAKADRGP